MTDKNQAGGGNPEEFLAALRGNAAICASLTEHHRETAAVLGNAAEMVSGLAPGIVELLTEVKGMEQRTLLQQAIYAEQAMAYEELLVAGGPENKQAYQEYEKRTKRNIELMGRPDSAP